MVRYDSARNEQIAVGTTAVTLADPRERKSIYIRNISTGGQKITVVFGYTIPVSLGGGIVLKPDDVIVDSTSEGYVPWAGMIRAIADAAGGSISIQER